MESLSYGHERTSFIRVPAEHVRHDRGFGRIRANAGRVAWAIRIGSIAIGRSSPRQHLAASQLVQTSSSRSFRDQSTFVLGYGSANLKEQLILRVVGEGAIDELHFATVALQFLQEQDLMHVVASQSIGIGDQDAIEFGESGEVAEPVESRSSKRSAGIAVVAEDVVFR